MSNEIATRSPEQALVARVREDDFRAEIAMALPPSVTPERFVRVTTTAILANPDIAKLEHNSVMRALIQCAADGLMPDGKEAAIVNRGGKASYTPMVGGFVNIAAEYGWLLTGNVVYANDAFSYTDEPPEIRHTSVRPGADRGDKIAAYAIAKHRDGRRMQLVFHPDEIADRRAMATTQAIWNKWEAPMWIKTPMRALFKKLPLAETDSEHARIARIIEASDLEPGDAARALYGTTDSPVDIKPSTTGPSDTTEHTGELPQADDAAKDTQTPSAAASPVPGTESDEEPDVGGSAVITADDGTVDASIELAANNAALFEIPNGKHRGVTLGELLDKDGGTGWLSWALDHISEPQDYVDALWNFSRGFAPELYTAALAKKEAEVTS